MKVFWEELSEGDRLYYKCFGLFISAVIMASSIIWVISSHFEASTYSELTGREVTTWQAMWVELRVQEDSFE